MDDNEIKKSRIELLEELKILFDLDTGRFISAYQEGVQDRNDEILCLLDKSIEGLKAVNNG